MKENELMIGDWVTFQCFDGSSINVRVTQIQSSALGMIYGRSETRSHWANVEDVKPIPLTLEILEKNGFMNGKDGYDIGIPLLYWDKYCNAICGYTHGDDIVEVFDCKCVHELQHALKLCGIEKEIEL